MTGHKFSTLIKDVKTQELLGDPGYDGENIYRMLRKKGIKPTIRPPNHLATKKAKTERQQNAAYQQTKGYPGQLHEIYNRKYSITNE